MALASPAQCLDEEAAKLRVRQTTLAREQVMTHLDHPGIIELVIQVVPELLDGSSAIDRARFVRHAISDLRLPWQGRRPSREP